MKKVPTPRPDDNHPITPLRAIVLSENPAAYVRALNLYAYLAVALADEIPLQFSWLTFAALDAPNPVTPPRHALLTADVLIIAAATGPEWPEAFKTGLNTWLLPAARNLGALGALLIPAHPHFGTACGRQAYLQGVAARWRVDFLTAAPATATAILRSTVTRPPPPPEFDFHTVELADPPAGSPYCGING